MANLRKKAKYQDIDPGKIFYLENENILYMKVVDGHINIITEKYGNSVDQSTEVILFSEVDLLIRHNLKICKLNGLG